jgi:hypothetical protein
MAKPAPQGGCCKHAYSQAVRMGTQKPHKFCGKLKPAAAGKLPQPSLVRRTSKTPLWAAGNTVDWSEVCQLTLNVTLVGEGRQWQYFSPSGVLFCQLTLNSTLVGRGLWQKSCVAAYAE